MRFFLFFSLMLLLVSCGGPASSSAPPSPVPFPVGLRSAAPGEGEAPAPRLRAVPLTQQAAELRRIREQHSSLIASIPPTPAATPTLTVAGMAEVATARVRNHPEGYPIPPRVGEDWFDPSVGIDFYRDSGDDWTARRVRESHPHRELFYFSRYPDFIPNFSDRSIYLHLSRELVFEAVATLPLLGEPTPAMIAAFSDNLGWELRDSPEPVINLWTTFTVRREGSHHTYGVGGVMRLGVASAGEDDDLVEYVTPGIWLGPVVVERLR